MLFSEVVTAAELIDASRIALSLDTASDRKYEQAFHIALINYINANAGVGGAFTGLTGDIGASNNGVTTIATNVVTNTKLALMPTLTVKGNNTGGSANPLDLTMTQLNVMLPSVVGSTPTVAGTKGLIPAAGVTDINKVFKGCGMYGSTIPIWGASTSYNTDDVIYDGTTSNNKIYSCTAAHISGNTITLGNFKELSIGTTGSNVGAITTVFGRTGVVIATTNDYTAANIANVAAGGITTTDVQSALNGLDTNKQPLLVSATNIKTINGSSLLGAGNIVISGSGGNLLDKYNAGANVFVLADSNTITATKTAGVFTITIPTGVHCTSINVNVLSGDIQTGADASGATNWINIIVNSNNVGGATGVYKIPSVSGIVIPGGTFSATNQAPYNVTNQGFIGLGTNTITFRKTNMVVGNDYLIVLTSV